MSKVVVVGSFALFMRGISESFNDVDIVIGRECMGKLRNSLESIGISPEFRDHGEWQELAFPVAIGGNVHDASIITAGKGDIYMAKLGKRERVVWNGSVFDTCFRPDRGI